MRQLDKRIAETKSPSIRNRARRARLINLEWASRNEEAIACPRGLAADKSYSSDDRRFFRERIARFLHQLKRDDEALAAYDELFVEAKDNPHRAAFYLDEKVAVMLFRAERYAEALECCDRAIKLEKPDTVEWKSVEWWRVRTLTALERPAEVCTGCEKLLDSKNLAPDDLAWCLATLADLLAKRGLHDKALDADSRAQQVLDRDAKTIDEATGARVTEQLSKVSASPKHP